MFVEWCPATVSWDEYPPSVNILTFPEACDRTASSRAERSIVCLPVPFQIYRYLVIVEIHNARSCISEPDDRSTKEAITISLAAPGERVYERGSLLIFPAGVYRVPPALRQTVTCGSNQSSRYNTLTNKIMQLWEQMF